MTPETTVETARALGEGEGRRDLWQAMRRGWACKCPACGQGDIYGRYLKVVDECPACKTNLSHQRADDAPPYVTISIVGHIVVAALLSFDEFWPDAPFWIHAILWSTMTIVLSLWMLPRVKGALIGLQWANRMHGFGAEPDAA